MFADNLKLSDISCIMRTSNQIPDYLKFLLTARSKLGYGIHSPFVYEFAKEVFHNKTVSSDFALIEQIRKDIRADSTLIDNTDDGAGSHNRLVKRTAASIAKYTAVKKNYGRLLYRLTRFYKPDMVIELGTGLGISTMYLASGNPEGKVITIESNRRLAAKAGESFQKAGITNIAVENAVFDSALEKLKGQLTGNTVIFIDGNHTNEATIKYFEFFVKAAGNSMIMIFDDINWSKGMKIAWQSIKENKLTKVTVDSYFMGFVFQKEGLAKQNFKIRY